MAADFTFDIAAEPELSALKPLFAHILGPSKAKPTVSLGPDVQRGRAVTWLRAQQARYSASLGNRSSLIKNMDLASKVVLENVVDETP